MTITPTKLFVAGAPIEFIEGQPIKITIKRGVAHSTINFVVGTGRKADKALQAKKNPVDIELVCAGLGTVDEDSITLKGWYIIARREREKGFVQYQMADVRWHKSFNKLTAQYNIISYGGNYRADSVRGGTRWKAYDACVDALKKLEFSVTDNPKLADGIKGINLPDNLGNSKGGGWVAAPMDVALPPMLEAISCDPVVLEDGSIQLQDRVTEYSKDLTKYAVAMGSVGAASIKWQLPAQIHVPFQKRIERRATYDESAGATSSGDVPYNIDLDNVIPNYVSGSSEPVKDHTELKAYVKKNFMPLSQLRKRWFKRVLFNVLGKFTAAVLDKLLVIQSLVQQCYRQRFQFRPPESALSKNVSTEKTRAHFADIQLGRLQRDGTTRPDGLYMNYVEELRFGELANETDNPLTAKFTRNVAFNAFKPAPASAAWIDRENLIFEVQFARPRNRNYTGYFPGSLASARGYNSFKAASEGTAKFQMEDSVALKDDFTLYAYWNGLWTHDGDGDQSRLYTSTGRAFADGEIPVLTTRCVMDMTANYGTDYLNSFPGTLLNRDDLDARATEVADEVKASFVQKRAGIVTHVGIGVLKKGRVWTKGDIHEVQITVNGRKVGSVETMVTVLPGRRPKPQPVLTGRRPEGLEPMRIL